MKLQLENISKIVSDCEQAGYNIRMADIGYIGLLNFFEDKEIAYEIIFRNDSAKTSVKEYEKSPQTKYLKQYIKENFRDLEGEKYSSQKSKNATERYKSLTFEENKEAMILMLGELKQAFDNKLLEYKDYAKMVSDIRIKLNDKFQVSDKTDDKMIVVNSKYNDICPYCSHEIRVKTDKDLLEELKEEYDIIPKKKK